MLTGSERPSLTISTNCENCWFSVFCVFSVLSVFSCVGPLLVCVFFAFVFCVWSACFCDVVSLVVDLALVFFVCFGSWVKLAPFFRINFRSHDSRTSLRLTRFRIVFGYAAHIIMSAFLDSVGWCLIWSCCPPLQMGSLEDWLAGVQAFYDDAPHSSDSIAEMRPVLVNMYTVVRARSSRF